MGIRIHRAMGWGMPWSDFERLTTLKEEDGDHSKYWLSHLLYETFEQATHEQLTLTEEEHKAQWDAPGTSILERHLTSTKFTLGTGEEPVFGSPTDLYFDVGYDVTDHVGFLPALYLKDKWSRYDDDLDYAFERLRDGPAGSADIRDLATYSQFGHYPWTNDLMYADGSHMPWRHWYELKDRDDWFPAVPAEIRWYLKKLEIMDDAGINQLRPMIAQWWS